MDSRIKQNNNSAIYYENKVTEQMVKIYGVNHESCQIKGRIRGESGVVQPRLIIQDNIYDLIEELRKETRLTLSGGERTTRGCYVASPKCFGCRAKTNSVTRK